MSISDIDRVIPLYLDQYNRVEGGCWTVETATRRIRQVLTMEDSFSLIVTDADRVCGFAMGYFKQYDDILGYTLEEIVIDPHLQNRGLGTQLLAELESRVRSAGAACIELQAVKDEMHEAYYGKAGFKDAKNFVLKVKWF
jgi:ribosomal protein S18 acetylase RimI-like enzyme